MNKLNSLCVQSILNLNIVNYTNQTEETALCQNPWYYWLINNKVTKGRVPKKNGKLSTFCG